uniref:Protein Diedel-like n=1 Tax=Mocis latipes granulovirus TaxID=2072024 RepID=A0A161C724_9BBAC
MFAVKVIVLLVCALIITSGETKCCRKIVMVWQATTCYPYTVHNSTSVGGENKWCKAKICNNGLTNRGFFCGVGDCNIFGCNCDYGCIEGDPVYNFRYQTGITHARPTIDFSDLSIW